MINHGMILIGAGNLACQIGPALKRAGVRFRQVFSRSEESAEYLASKLGCGHTCSLQKIDGKTAIILFALPDDILPEVLKSGVFNGRLLVHTAGSVPLDVFRGYTENFGVFYPLQTFSKNRTVEISEIPFFIEANNSENENLLRKLACRLSSRVYTADSDTRKKLHVAAVFACNYVNHLYHISKKILEANEISFEALRPLIMETAKKVMEAEPGTMQTGPAVRYDRKIIGMHTDDLAGFPDYQEIYTILAKSIHAHFINSNP